MPGSLLRFMSAVILVIFSVTTIAPRSYAAELMLPASGRYAGYQCGLYACRH